MKKVFILIGVAIGVLVLGSIGYYMYVLEKPDAKENTNVISTPGIFPYEYTTKDECNIEHFNKDKRSEHVIVREVFWKESPRSCFIVTSYAHTGTAADWAVDAEAKGLLGSEFLEAITYAVWSVGDGSTDAPILTRTYQYQSLEEYLKNPRKFDDWENDFFAQVVQYR